MRLSQFVAVALATSMLGACKLTQEPHRGTEHTWSPAQEGFSFTANGTLNLAAVEELLNKSVPNTLHVVDESVGKCLTSTKVLKFYGLKTKWDTTCLLHASIHVKGPIERNGRIRVSGTGETIRVEVPVKAQMRLTPNSDKVRKATGLRETVEVALTAVAEAKAQLRPDWTPQVAVATDFKWDKRPQIEIIGIPITFGSRAEKPVREQLAALSAKLPSLLPAEKVKADVARTWASAYTPIQVLASPPLWLAVEPNAAQFSGIDTRAGLLRASFNLAGTGRMTLGAKPSAAPVKPLPDLRVDGKPDPISQLTLPVILPYAGIAAEMKKALEDTQFRIEDESADPKLKGSVVKLTGVDVFPSKDALGLEAKVRIDVPGRFLDVKGSLFVLIKPVVDHPKRLVRLDQLDITAVTDSTLVNAASIAAFKSGILEEMKPLLTYSYVKEFDSAVTKATSSLNLKTPKLAVTTKLEGVDVDSPVVATQGLVLPVRVRLRAELAAGV